MSVGSVTARIARRICDQEDVGYSQPDRRTWYANANWEGHVSSPQDADCSSLAAGAVCYGLHDTYGVSWGHPALPEINDHWTGNLRPGLEARGFDEVPWADENLTPDGGFRAGDIVLSAANEGGVGHVIIIVEDGYDPLESEAWIAEDGSIDGYLGDQTGGETRTARYSTHPHTQAGRWTSCHRFNEAKFFQQWPEFAKGKTQAAAPAASSAPAHAHGIDISSHQGGLHIAAIWADFVIVKITEGTGYENPYWRTQAEATLAAGKRLGLYLFANDEDAGEQARFFLDRAKVYAGRATFWLDWEADALNLAPEDALVILNQMAAETGSTPGIYLNGEGMESGDWSAIAGRFPLWYAGGPNYASYGQAYSDPPTPTVPYWGGNVLVHQYTEDGRLPGYNDHLDLDRLRDRATWDRMIGGGQVIAGAPAPVSTSGTLQVDGEYGPATMQRLIDVFAPGYNEMFAVGNLRRYLNSTVAANAQRMLIGADKLPEDRGWDSHVIRIFQYWAWCCVRPVAPEMWARFADGWSFGEYVDGEPGEATWAALQEALNRSRPGSFRLM